MNAAQAACAPQAAHDTAGTGLAATAVAFLGGVQGGNGDAMQDGGVVRGQLLISGDAP